MLAPNQAQAATALPLLPLLNLPSAAVAAAATDAMVSSAACPATAATTVMANKARLQKEAASHSPVCGASKRTAACWHSNNASTAAAAAKSWPDAGPPCSASCTSLSLCGATPTRSCRKPRAAAAEVEALVALSTVVMCFLGTSFLRRDSMLKGGSGAASCSR
jgi:hypothetical protein